MLLNMFYLLPYKWTSTTKDTHAEFKKVWRKIFFASLLNISFRQKNITELRVEDDKIKVILHDHIILPTKSSSKKELVIELVIAIGRKHK